MRYECLVPDVVVSPSQKTDALIGFPCTKVSRSLIERRKKKTEQQLWSFSLYGFVYIMQAACIYISDNKQMLFAGETYSVCKSKNRDIGVIH